MGGSVLKTIAVFFGGLTCEHDVSIVSGLQAVNALNPQDYRVVPVYIARDGEWYVGEKLRNIKFYPSFNPWEVDRVLPMAAEGKMALVEHPSRQRLFRKLRTFKTIDVALPVMHGMNGEDGTLQGLFELMDVPYTCSGVLGSAVGMDKIVMKQYFRACGFPVLPDTWLDRAHWEAGREAELDRIEAALPYPMYVKPANLGSSIGIGRADDRAGLTNAIDIAASYDRRVLVEKGVAQIQEVNCSVLGWGLEAKASVLEMPIRWDDAELLNFDSKYLSGEGGKGMDSMSRRIPAPIEDALTDAIRALSLEVFKSLDSKGVVRIDYIIDQSDGSYYVGEINTIPGSLSNTLWAATDMTFAELLDAMIEYAIAAHAEKRRNVFTYDSSILSKVSAGAKMGKK